MKKENKRNKLNKYVYEVQLLDEEWFIFNLLNFNYVISDKSLKQTEIAELDSDTREVLYDLGFISDIDEQTLCQSRIKEWKNKIKSDYNPSFETLVFKIMPTLLCNFRCSYCYQPELYLEETRRKTEYMRTEVLDAFFEYIENNIIQKEKRKIRLEIVGGEVFLKNRNAIRFVEHLIEKTINYNMELIFVTNG